jgi:Spy/CpxP family protein refolding chaperone
MMVLIGLMLVAAPAVEAGMPGGGMMGGQGGMMGGQGGMMGGHGMMGGRMDDDDHGRGRGEHHGREWSHEGPLISIMLAHRDELGLRPEQETRLRELRVEATKDVIRRTADVRVAELDLDVLLERETWDTAAIEAKAKQIATLEGDRRIARLKALAAARAVLTPDQLRRLQEVGHRMRGREGRGPGAHGTGPGGHGPGMGPGMMGPGPGRGAPATPPAPAPSRP